MTYATQQDLIDRFGETELVQLSNRAGGATVDATVVDRALADADAEIDSYLAARYTLPLSPVPEVVARLAADMARFYLFDDRATEQVSKRYDNAVKLLRSIASGAASIGVDSADAQPAIDGGPSADANDRVFTTGRPSRGTAGTLDDYLQ